MKLLPYFRWYPADAETDEAYSMMSDAELGVYHRCLNLSWVNNGLPADPDTLAAILKVKRSYLDKIWVRVGKKFYEQDGRLFNRRQEEERERAMAVSDKASVSSAHRQDDGPGFLYLIRRPKDGAVKIGTTNNVPRRLAQLKHKYQDSLSLIQQFSVSNMSQSEVSIHANYKAKRNHGEWFSLSEGDIAEITITLEGDIGGDNKDHPTPRVRARADSLSESASVSQKKTSLREVPKGLPDPGCQDFEVRFERLYVAHPKTGFEFEARARYISLITSAVNPDAEADRIDASAKRWREFWLSHPGEFVPTLSKWFEDKYYLKHPVLRESPRPRNWREEQLANWDYSKGEPPPIKLAPFTPLDDEEPA